MNAARVVVTVVFTADPLGPKVGGAETFIRGFLEHAPAHFDLRYVGVTCDPVRRPVGTWSDQRIGGRAFRFLPVLLERNEDHKRKVPIALRFAAVLMRQGLPDDGSLLVHNRLETLAVRGCRRHRNLLFVHNDVAAQLGAGSEVLWSRFPWAYYTWERRAFAHVDFVWTVSARTLEDCRRRYAARANRFDFVPTWVDGSRFAPARETRAVLRARLRESGIAVPDDGRWVLFVGRLQRQKAPERMIAAFAALRATCASARLLVVGDGNLRAEVEAQVAAEGMQHSVHLLGALPQSRLALCYQAADVLLLTSNFEGMPMSVLEALSCGLPVVSTDVGEVHRVVHPGLNGELAARAEPECLADALRMVLGSAAAYDRAACVAAVSRYRPHEVLAPIYRRLQVLAEADRSASAGAGSVP